MEQRRNFDMEPLRIIWTVPGSWIREAARPQFGQGALGHIDAKIETMLELGDGRIEADEEPGTLRAMFREDRARARMLMSRGFVGSVLADSDHEERASWHTTPLVVEIFANTPLAEGFAEIVPVGDGLGVVDVNSELAIRLYAFGTRKAGRLEFTAGRVHIAAARVPRELPPDCFQIVARGERGAWFAVEPDAHPAVLDEAESGPGEPAPAATD